MLARILGKSLQVSLPRKMNPLAKLFKSSPTPLRRWSAMRSAFTHYAIGRLNRALTVLELGALSDLDNITVRIADVAANLAVLGNRFRDELGSSTFPQFVA